MMEILLEIALGIDVPADHVTRVAPLPPRGPSKRRIRATGRWCASSPDRNSRPTSSPRCATATPGTGSTDRDYRSKRALSVLMLFFSLAETGVTPQAPLLTVPAN